jgi:hypothetical protein
MDRMDHYALAHKAQAVKTGISLRSNSGTVSRHHRPDRQGERRFVESLARLFSVVLVRTDSAPCRFGRDDHVMPNARRLLIYADLAGAIHFPWPTEK